MKYPKQELVEIFTEMAHDYRRAETEAIKCRSGSKKLLILLEDKILDWEERFRSALKNL